ncbi:MAG: carbonic anhydrase [Kiritimatiellae bacterium]|jgi:carbonic anhydrase|nr:carbonic anhydrase [Kiritimatiellia bacterium]
MKKCLFAPCCLLLLLTGCRTHSPSAPHWGYIGENGPEHWASLSPDFCACGKGQNQSPVNLAGHIEAELPDLNLDYQPGGREMVNNGHTVQMNYEPGSYLIVDDIRFELKQFHVHVPSEHTIDGKAYPMEIHFVHADSRGRLAVVGLLIEDGAENEFLADLLPHIPGNKHSQSLLPTLVDATSLLPEDKSYFRYNGSLTTPPCTEGVRWIVLKTPVAAFINQINAFAQALQLPNNRPLQPINARPVLGN